MSTLNQTINHFSFLSIGKTQESREGSDFKRYIGLGSSYVLAVNPSKKELDELRGFESKEEPVYVKDGENGKEVSIHFLVRTDPNACNGVEMTNLVMFTLRPQKAYNNDKTRLQVIDDYGNYAWTDVDEHNPSGFALPAPTAKVDPKTARIAMDGECDLVDFLKKYLGVPSSLNYVNGAWVLADNAEEGKFRLEHLKDYFNGDFSELREALALQPKNKLKLLYGIKTKEDGKQVQTVATKGEFFLYNNAGSKAYTKLEKDLASAKNAGKFSNVEFRVQELAEYEVQPTNLENLTSSPAPAADPLTASWDNW